MIFSNSRFTLKASSMCSKCNIEIRKRVYLPYFLCYARTVTTIDFLVFLADYKNEVKQSNVSLKDNRNLFTDKKYIHVSIEISLHLPLPTPGGPRGERVG